jgi:hypothetical protein
MPTTRQFLESLDFPSCAYCCAERATQRDHVVPKAMRRRHHIDAKDERFHVPSCMPCNLRKSTLHLYPRGFDVSILPGNPKVWRMWNGDPKKLRAA